MCAGTGARSRDEPRLNSVTHALLVAFLATRRTRRRLHDAALQSANDCCETGARIELGHDRAHVSSHRRVADAEALGDRRVIETASHELQYLELPRRKRID